MFVSVMYHRDFLDDMALKVFCQSFLWHLMIFRGFSGGSLVKNLNERSLKLYLKFAFFLQYFITGKNLKVLTALLANV